tara:strand:+ start:501 stop:1253 length:753 start_codon:yes stop_codon:yes gene_type:complete
MNKYIFDIDGTLTVSRAQIDPDFRVFMLSFALEHDVYLVTGSDRKKTIEQVGADLYNLSQRVYNCSGSDVYEGDKNVYRSEWELPREVERFLEDELAYSCFDIRNGNHIEHRPGGVNFSILGRDKNPFKGRAEYIKWDKERLEREDIADRIRNAFPGLTVALGGQTGLDIGPAGSDKSQILRDFDNDDELVFYGDMMEEGQNDYPLAIEVEKMGGRAHKVDTWEDTWELLKEEKEETNHCMEVFIPGFHD